MKHEEVTLIHNIHISQLKQKVDVDFMQVLTFKETLKIAFKIF